jgi:hypothetical protein
MQFCRVNICRADTQFTIVCDEISHCRNSDVIRIIFLGKVVGDRVCKGKELLLTVCVSNFFVCHDKHSILPLLAHFIIILHHLPKIFSTRSLPYFCSDRVVHVFRIAGNSLPHDRMDHWISAMFKVDTGGCWGGVGKHSWGKGWQWMKCFVHCHHSECLLQDQPHMHHWNGQACPGSNCWIDVFLHLNNSCQFDLVINGTPPGVLLQVWH